MEVWDSFEAKTINDLYSHSNSRMPIILAALMAIAPRNDKNEAVRLLLEHKADLDVLSEVLVRPRAYQVCFRLFDPLIV